VKLLSLIGYLLMAAGLVGLLAIRALVAPSAVAIGLQAVAVALTIWARLTFGVRSFHATANTTRGSLVTTGPYRYMRHPIYASIVLFTVGSVVGHPSWLAGGFGFVILAGAVARMLIEERFLLARYPEYAAYAARTKRMVPYLV
jgi:protein-S-isoprenylcysteine O-methyltransferase Ste14